MNEDSSSSSWGSIWRFNAVDDDADDEVDSDTKGKVVAVKVDRETETDAAAGVTLNAAALQATRARRRQAKRLFIVTRYGTWNAVMLECVCGIESWFGCRLILVGSLTFSLVTMLTFCVMPADETPTTSPFLLSSFFPNASKVF